MTSHILPSLNLLYLLSFPALALAYLRTWLGRERKFQLKHAWSINFAKRAVAKDLWRHQIILGLK